MASSRKDTKGYVLSTGECQRSDGRYSYSYTDLEDGIDAHAPEKTTVNQLYDKYISEKYDLKPTTKANYIYMYDHFVRESFGRKCE